MSLAFPQQPHWLNSPRIWASAMLVSGLLAVSIPLSLGERLQYLLKTSIHEHSWEARSLWLPDYRVVIEAQPVATVEDNLSGLTYDEQRDHLWAVVNNPEELLALGKDGSFIARYPLEGFSDVEGITYLGDGLLVVVEERSHALVIIPVPVQPGALRREDYQSFTVGTPDGDNEGFEGVGYDRAGDRLFVVKEHSPRELYEVRGVKASQGGPLDLTVIDRNAWLADKDMARDLSSVHFDEQTGHLLLLSDDAKMMLELDSQGALVSFRSLWRGLAGLENSVPQAEGMTLDDQGNLYLVSEPNLFYSFQRPRTSAVQPRRISQTPANISSSPATLPLLIGDSRNPAQPK